MTSPSLDHILKFVDLLHQFREVERVVLVRNSDRSENDGEHTFQLAMLAWYINEAYDLKLDVGKLLKYALAHDLVEVYAGDTYFFHADESLHASKQKREEDAAIKLRGEFAEFSELHEAIHQYEKREDRESKFIYALDKVEPMMSIYRDHGRTWKKGHITIDMLTSMKAPKVVTDTTIEKIFNELVERLRNEKSELFN